MPGLGVMKSRTLVVPALLIRLGLQKLSWMDGIFLSE